MAGIELIIMVFIVSLICGLIVRKVTRDNTIKEMKNNTRYYDDNNSVYDSNGKRVR